MTNEIPKEAEEFWLVRSRLTGDIILGMTKQRANGRLCFDTALEMFHDYEFDQFDWHRIELPEGWKV